MTTKILQYHKLNSPKYFKLAKPTSSPFSKWFLS